MSSTLSSRSIPVPNGRKGDAGANGTDGTSGEMELISTTTVSSAVASVTFTDLSSNYFKYIVEIEELQPATDSSFLIMRTSANNGSSYDSGASDYDWTYNVRQLNGENSTQSATQSYIQLIADVTFTGERMGTAANETGSGFVEILNPSAAKFTMVRCRCIYVDKDSQYAYCFSSGFRASAAAVDAIEFLFNSGDIAAGTFKLYGVKA